MGAPLLHKGKPCVEVLGEILPALLANPLNCFCEYRELEGMQRHGLKGYTLPEFACSRPGTL